MKESNRYTISKREGGEFPQPLDNENKESRLLKHSLLRPLRFSGIKRFEDGRKAKVIDWTLCQFHNGGNASAFVDSWIGKLEENVMLGFLGFVTLFGQCWN